ncbi:hypothetical protein EG329_010916 [Mollisiaceae sp. DMI_Dod_QoI]|nr:hypothetical protein EG329_010916 [Helotiales sp. DMI_Dod_QoI]
MDFDEKRQKGELDFRVKEIGEALSQKTPIYNFISSASPTRRPIDRPLKKGAVPLVTSMPRSMNNFSIEIPASMAPPTRPITPAITTAKAQPKDIPHFPSPAREIKKLNTTDSDPSGGAVNGGEKRKDHNANESTRAAKRVKALTAAFIAQKIIELEIESEESAFIAAEEVIDITISKTYKKAVTDLEHGDK